MMVDVCASRACEYFQHTTLLRLFSTFTWFSWKPPEVSVNFGDCYSVILVQFSLIHSAISAAAELV